MFNGFENKWEIYDALIREIPPHLKVKDCLVGTAWTLLRSSTTGAALGHFAGKQRLNLVGKILGRPVQEIAQYAKSWNPCEASLGIAAINSALNTEESFRAIYRGDIAEQPQVSIFTYMKDQVKGKNVAVVGHFPDLDVLEDICSLSILERNPQSGDYPDSACEYILKDQDYVFITSSTLMNKTLPRLLELSADAFVCLVGPSTPLHPVLFNFGIDLLAGILTADEPLLWQTVKEGGAMEILQRGGYFVKIGRDELNKTGGQGEG